jgi:site-specific recombinase XerD
MKYKSFDDARRLANEATGPLAHYIRQHLEIMVEQGYVERTVYVRTYRAADFDRWLEATNIPLTAVDERRVALYHRQRSGHLLRPWRNELRFLRMLLVYLRANGAIPPLPVVSDYPAIDRTIDGFAHHLRHNRGLAAVTIVQYSNYARDLLTDRFGAAQVCLAEITATDVIEHIRRLAPRRSPAMLKTVVTALRSFLRYSLYIGETEPGLIAAVPTVAFWATTPPMPRAITPEHAQQLIAHFSGTSRRELRDRAILLLLARLGLRSGDIVYMKLDDIDWDKGCLRVRGKGRRECFMPMPPDVGEAIATYLRNGRPPSTDRRLFLRLVAPFRGLAVSHSTSSVVKNALAHAGVDAPRRGAHQFRHALAVRMMEQGASLPEIGEVLRHRSPQATAIYARVGLDALRDLVMSWPGEVA